MPAKYWIKLYMEILDDPKMGRLPDYLFRRAIELFLVAGESGNDGALQPVPQLAWRLRLDETKLRESLRALSEVGVVYEAEPDQWIVTNFQKRQDAATATERSREYRKRNDYATERFKTCNENATVAMYTEAEEESDTESESIPTTPSSSRAENFQKVVLPRGKLIDSGEACRVYTAITGHTVPPSHQREKIEQTIIDIALEQGGAEQTVAFLRPFWAAWTERKYSPTNAAWLLDWSVTRKIPPKRPTGAAVPAPAGGKIQLPIRRQEAAMSKLAELEASDGK